MRFHSRRTLLRALLGGAMMFSVVQRSNAEEQKLSEDDPEAKTLHYVTDVSRAKDAKPGQKCATCSLYAGDRQSTAGPCPVFDNKLVSANGWCKSWMNM